MDSIERKRVEKDIAFMQDPMQWPMLVLPVKKRGNFEVGVMIGDGPKVYLHNIFDSTPLRDAPVEEYIDYYGVVDAGWRVD